MNNSIRRKRIDLKGHLIVVSAVAVIWSCVAGLAFSAEPQIVLGWSIANSGPDIGSTREEMREGWPAFIKKYVNPGIDWAKAGGLEPSIYLAHPFGQYATQADDAMHIDGWDYARAARATHLTNNFATDKGWKSVTSRVPCYAYVGGMHLTERLKNLPPREFADTVERNLKPLVDAGFKGVYIDWAENAIPHHFKNDKIPSESLPTRSLDTVTMAIADSMFPEKSGVESSPRNFKDFRLLFSRNVVMAERQWQLRFGPNRHKEFKALGYDRDVLTGSIWRTLDFKDDPTVTLAEAKSVYADKCIPVLNPLPFIVKGVKASAILDK
jgi:hypothetical protein